MSEHAQSVHAIDVSAEAIDYARSHWLRSNITHDIQDLHFLELPDSSKYDVIVAFEIIEHLIEPRLFLQRARAHIQAKGRLFISVPNEKKIPHTVDLNPFHMRHYTPSEVTELLEGSGYAVNAILSQDTKELTPGTSGNFLIVEATPTAEKRPDVLAQLCQNAVTAGVALIGARATVLAKAKRDIQTLKLQLVEAKEKGTAVLQGAQQSELTSALNVIGQRIQVIEGALVSDLRQRNNLLETSERLARDSLSTAQFQIIRLKDEKRALSVELKRAEVWRVEQSQELSRLKTELSALSRTMEMARADAVQFPFIKESLTDHKIQLDRSRTALAEQTAKMESERAASQLDRERFIEESRALEDRMAETQRELARQVEEQAVYSKDWQARLAAAEVSIVDRDARILDQGAQLIHIFDDQKNRAEQINALSQQVAEQKSQLDGNKKKLIELQGALTVAQVEVEARKKEVNASTGKTKHISIKLLAVAAENEVLRKTNESLALELDKAKHSQPSHGAVITDAVMKAPPSLGLIWSKLKRHSFYGPFIGRAIRNSLGVKLSRKTVTRRRP